MRTVNGEVMKFKSISSTFKYLDQSFKGRVPYRANQRDVLMHWAEWLNGHDISISGPHIVVSCPGHGVSEYTMVNENGRLLPWRRYGTPVSMCKTCRVNEGIEKCAESRTGKALRNLRSRLDKRTASGKGAHVDILTEMASVSDIVEFSCSVHGKFSEVLKKVRDNWSFTCPSCGSYAVSVRIRQAAADANKTQVLEEASKLGYEVLNPEDDSYRPYKARCTAHGTEFFLPKVSNKTSVVKRQCPDCVAEEPARRGMSRRLRNDSRLNEIKQSYSHLTGMEISENPDYSWERFKETGEWKYRDRLKFVCKGCGTQSFSATLYKEKRALSSERKNPRTVCETCNTGIETKDWIKDFHAHNPWLKRVRPDQENPPILSTGKDLFRAYCNLHDQEFVSARSQLHKGCPSCRSLRMTTPERFVYQHLRTLLRDDEIIVRDRTEIYPLELDFWVPSVRTAIEVDGIYWHGHESKQRGHRVKRERCEQENIRLVSFNEKQIEKKPDLVKSMISHRLGFVQKKRNARDLTVERINASRARKFLEKSHLSGFVAAKYHFGLVNPNGSVLCLMSVGPPRFKRKEDLEIIRFASMPDRVVRGGFQKILSHVVRSLNPSTLVSYCDLRVGEGKVYESSGFHLSRTTSPSYEWWRGEECIRRYSSQKHKLNDLLEHFDPELTEDQNMKENNYMKVYDYGNRVYIKTIYT